MVRVLIPTQVTDIHAQAVKHALEQKGHEAVLWYGADLPTRQEVSIEIRPDASYAIEAHGPDLDLGGDFDVVWFRRPTMPQLPEDMHPGDRTVAQRDCEHFFRGIWHMVGAEAFWVNPMAGQRRSNTKPVQLYEAARAGLSIPPTICTNDPERIRRFIKENPRQTIYKPFHTAQWKKGDNIAYLFTSVVTLDDLPEDEVLRLTPGIFQPRIDKAYELRVTFMGDWPLAVKLDSQALGVTEVDWRAGTREVPMEPTILPEPVAQKCRLLMQRLGIVFGCFDFIVTPEGEHVFVEVNPMGQFLWLEELRPELQLLDAFCEFLIQKRLDFVWQPSSGSVRFAELNQAAARASYEAVDRRHVDHLTLYASDDNQSEPGTNAG